MAAESGNYRPNIELAATIVTRVNRFRRGIGEGAGIDQSNSDLERECDELILKLESSDETEKHAAEERLLTLLKLVVGEVGKLQDDPNRFFFFCLFI